MTSKSTTPQPQLQKPKDPSPSKPLTSGGVTFIQVPSIYHLTEVNDFSKEDDKELNHMLQDMIKSETSSQVASTSANDFYNNLLKENDATVTLRDWAQNFLHKSESVTSQTNFDLQLSKGQIDKFFNLLSFKKLQKRQLLEHLSMVERTEHIHYNYVKTKDEVYLESNLASNGQELKHQTAVTIFDNENYEYLTKKISSQNLILKDRLEECKRMMSKYDYACEKWKNIFMESSIIKEDILTKVGHLNHSLNLEKKDQLTRIHMRKVQLSNLELIIQDYDKDLEYLKEQEIDLKGKIFLRQMRIKELNKRCTEIAKKKFYWKEKLESYSRKFVLLQKRFRIKNSKDLLGIIMDKVTPKIIQYQSVENYTQDHLQAILKLHTSKGQLKKELDKIKNNNRIYHIEEEISISKKLLLEAQERNTAKMAFLNLIKKKQQEQINFTYLSMSTLLQKIRSKITKRDQVLLSHIFEMTPLDTEKGRNMNYSDINKQVFFLDRIMNFLINSLQQQIPLLDPSLQFAEKLPQNQQIILTYFPPQLAIKSDKPDFYQQQDITSHLDLRSLSSNENHQKQIRIYSGLNLTFQSLQFLYQEFFEESKPQSQVLLHRKKTIRMIGMDMVKRQANILIESKKTTDFEVYFHTKRQTDKMRKEMHIEIKELQKKKKQAKLKEQLIDALSAKIDKMNQKEQLKQELEAQNFQKVNQEMKILFSENKNIQKNDFIKNKWEAQNLLHYRKAENQYRSLRTRIDKTNNNDNLNGNDKGLTFQAQKIKQKAHWDKIINQRKQSEGNQRILPTESQREELLFLDSKSTTHSGFNSNRHLYESKGIQQNNDITPIHLRNLSTPMLQMISNPCQSIFTQSKFNKINTRNNKQYDSGQISGRQMKTRNANLPTSQKERLTTEDQDKEFLAESNCNTAILPTIDTTIKRTERTINDEKSKTFKNERRILINTQASQIKLSTYESTYAGNLTTRAADNKKQNAKLLYKVMIKSNQNHIVQHAMTERTARQQQIPKIFKTDL